MPAPSCSISHDRDFLDRVVNAVIVPEGDGRWIEYAGGYTDMLAQRGARPRRAKPGKPPVAETRRQTPSRRRASPSRGKRRLSFNDKHALETLAEDDRRAAGQGAGAARPAR